jgi:hypothetical protein
MKQMREGISPLGYKNGTIQFVENVKMTPNVE